MTFYTDPSNIPGGVPTSEPTEIAKVKIQRDALLRACRYDYGGVAPDLPNLLEWAASAIIRRTPKDQHNVIPDKLALAASLIRAALAQVDGDA